MFNVAKLILPYTYARFFLKNMYCCLSHSINNKLLDNKLIPSWKQKYTIIAVQEPKKYRMNRAEKHGNTGQQSKYRTI